jgi:hypothetical protein
MEKMTFKQYLMELDRSDLEWQQEIEREKQQKAERHGVKAEFGQGLQKGDVLEYKGKLWPLMFSSKGVHPKGMKGKEGQDMWFQPSRFKFSGKKTELGKRIFVPA